MLQEAAEQAEEEAKRPELPQAEDPFEPIEDNQEAEPIPDVAVQPDSDEKYANLLEITAPFLENIPPQRMQAFVNVIAEIMAKVANKSEIEKLLATRKVDALIAKERASVEAEYADPELTAENEGVIPQEAEWLSKAERPSQNYTRNPVEPKVKTAEPRHNPLVTHTMPLGQLRAPPSTDPRLRTVTKAKTFFDW